MDSVQNTYLTLLKMASHDPRYESMLFNYETTSKLDYRSGAIFDSERTVYKEKPTCLRVRPPPLKDIQTMKDWKNPGVPIDLLVKPKEVVRSDPYKIQQPYFPPEDLEKARVRSTRPRLVMTPAVSMDDIQDENQREILTKEMYKSSTHTAMNEGIASLLEEPGSVRSPLDGTLSPANAITIEKLRFPYVSPQWRMHGVSWDSRQLRAYCDPTKEFYLSRPIRCKFCDVTAAQEKARKIMKKAKHKI